MLVFLENFKAEKYCCSVGKSENIEHSEYGFTASFGANFNSL